MSDVAGGGPQPFGAPNQELVPTLNECTPVVACLISVAQSGGKIPFHRVVQQCLAVALPTAARFGHVSLIECFCSHLEGAENAMTSSQTAVATIAGGQVACFEWMQRYNAQAASRKQSLQPAPAPAPTPATVSTAAATPQFAARFETANDATPSQAGPVWLSPWTVVDPIMRGHLAIVRHLYDVHGYQHGHDPSEMFMLGSPPPGTNALGMMELLVAHNPSFTVTPSLVAQVATAPQLLVELLLFLARHNTCSEETWRAAIAQDSVNADPYVQDVLIALWEQQVQQQLQQQC